MDIELKVAHRRLSDKEQKLAANENKLAQLVEQKRVLESHMKIRETTSEQKTKALQKVNKTAVEQVTKLKEQVTSCETRYVIVQNCAFQLNFTRTNNYRFIVT